MDLMLSHSISSFQQLPVPSVRSGNVLLGYQRPQRVRRGFGRSLVFSSTQHFVETNIDDEEWQKESRRQGEELKRRRAAEAEEERLKTENYRDISQKFDNFNEDEVKEAKALVASFIRAGEEVEEKIIEAAEAGKLTKLVLLVIQNRLELARHDDQRHVIQALDLLFRRIEAEMMRREASPALQYLDELLNLHDGSNHDEWLRKCRQSMIKTFPPEDAYTFLAPPGFNFDQNGPIDGVEDDFLLRVDFIREVDAFLAEITKQNSTFEQVDGLDPQSVAILLNQQQRAEAIQQVRDIRKLAIELKW